MRVMSWNVNGLRAVAKKGFTEWLHRSGADILGLQETKAYADQLPADVREPRGWHSHFRSAERAGYSGVALYSKKRWDDVGTSLLVDEFDVEGRLQVMRFGRLWVANVYFPNGSGKLRDNSRVPYKLRFYQRLFDVLEGPKKLGERILVMGDYNVAHHPIDLARPKSNVNTSGFLVEEREEMTRLLKLGWVDTFRRFEKGPGHYSWWTQRGGAREKNVGWRIDYVLASPGVMNYVKSAHIHNDVYGSDHCPVSVVLDPSVVLP